MCQGVAHRARATASIAEWRLDEGPEPVGMVEICRATTVRGKMASSCINFATIPRARRTNLRDFVSGEIVEKIYGRARNCFPDAVAIRVIHVARGPRRTNTAFGIVGVCVRAIVKEIARKIVGISVRTVVVRRGIPGEGKRHCVRAILLPAIPGTVVHVIVDRLPAVLIRADDAIKSVIVENPVAVGAVICRENIAIGSVAAEGQTINGVVSPSGKERAS